MSFPLCLLPKSQYLHVSLSILDTGKCTAQFSSFEYGTGVMLPGFRAKSLLIVYSWASRLITLSVQLRINICAHFIELLFKINKIMHLSGSAQTHINF